MKLSKKEMLTFVLFGGLLVTWLNLHLIDITKFIGMGMTFRFYVTFAFVMCMNILFLILLVSTVKEYRKKLNK